MLAALLLALLAAPSSAPAGGRWADSEDLLYGRPDVSLQMKTVTAVTATTLVLPESSALRLKSDDVVWQVEPPTAKPLLNATLRGSPSAISIAMMRGECEHRQIVLAAAGDGAAELRDIRVHVSDATPALDASWRFLQVGYVNCTANADLRGTTLGWFPDILLEQPTGSAAGVVVELVPPANIQPLWVEICTPENASAGNHTGELTVTGARATPGAHESTQFNFSVSFVVEVWDLTMPKLGSRGSISTAFELNGDTHAPQTAQSRLDGLTKYYPSYHAGSAIQRRFYRFLANHRIPADEIYTGPKAIAVPQLRPTSEFVELLGKEGMRVMTLLDVGKLNGTDRTWPKQLSDEFVSGVVQLVNESLEQLGVGNTKQPGLLPADLAADVITNRRLRIYGFDEAAPSSATAMRQLYGAIKKQYTWLRTMATVNTFTIPGSMPLDTWVTAYSTYLRPGSNSSRAMRREFESGGADRDMWWYWCPAQGCTVGVNKDCHGAVWPNPNVIQWPGIEARVIFWLAALHRITGMLFWADSWWVNECPGSRQFTTQDCAADYCDQPSCPTCCNLTGSINKTRKIGTGSAVCPEQLPICRGFVADQHYGTCQHQNASQPVCAPVRRINRTAKVDFNPAREPGAIAHKTAFGWYSLGSVDGGGYFFYPGDDGPLSSIRLEGLRDGAEDWSLFSMLGTEPDGMTSSAADLLTQLVAVGTPSDVDAPKSELYKDDWALMESLRRQAAHRMMSKRRVALKGDDETRRYTLRLLSHSCLSLWP